MENVLGVLKKISFSKQEMLQGGERTYTAYNSFRFLLAENGNANHRKTIFACPTSLATHFFNIPTSPKSVDSF